MSASRLPLAFPLCAALLLMAACASPSDGEEAAPAAPEAQTEAQALVDEAIAAHGMQALGNAVVEFDFRDAHFTVRREGRQFRYERAYTDSAGTIWGNGTRVQAADFAKKGTLTDRIRRHDAGRLLLVARVLLRKKPRPSAPFPVILPLIPQTATCPISHAQPSAA